MIPHADTPARPRTANTDRYRDGSAEQLLGEMSASATGTVRREDIRTELATLHAPIVHKIAVRYAHRGEPIDDIEQAAYLGLVKAINNFDPGIGDRFISYAVPVMQGEVKRHFRDRTWAIRVSRRLQELRAELNKTRQDFMRDHSRSPTVAELSVALGISEEETVEVISASEAYSPSSLDAPVSDEGDAATLGETLGAEDPELQHVVDGEALAPLLDELPETQRTVVLLRFYGNQTQAQIADQVGCSQMHVSRLLRRTLERLRQGLLAER
ncbi:SigB/SigF/SigG family RNA polymerase sigma factor [Actinomadura barringtoniae]|uniref:SigB/SigF/SigG family RNA polymerase sigma factor n=2 Tax=Actinomadura barringtoniae TaxID=1427535 RepID=A0A939T5H4_9ACTN|nr:SigB/SigF/SigG family RNA polymerase sigma factor [Actinomadura barringtoniae]